ncbi:MAG: hypothetical protein KDD73_07610 [Anaerolineales bacterium]|nr:hypothetical protein [Anaerolineales bacterium]MCB9126898.1 hypothetical protein [Ardenticatenales bacterium]MCB9171442.1 hypothetical protein [Ardenticatenales bacterium]
MTDRRSPHALPRPSALRQRGLLVAGALLSGALLLCCGAALLGWTLGAWRLLG